MNRVPLILIALGFGLGAGCFYTDPINQRPSVAIHPVTMGDLYRGQQLVTLDGVADDPDGDVVAFQWRAYACHQDGTAQTCDAVEYDSGVDHEFITHVPMTLADSSTPLNVVHVTLEGRDSYGATTRPSQIHDFNVTDAAPTLELRKQLEHNYVKGIAIDVYARIGDPDDVLDAATDASKITVSDWLAEGPASADNFKLMQDIAAPMDDATHFQLGKSFTPTAIGDWTIDVTATDPSGNATQQLLPIHVDADHAPCVGQWDPTATSVPNTTIPITDPTLFQVLVVADDLDPYPSLPNDPIFGTTEFHWSIVPPGGTRQALSGVTGSGVALDPNSYTPGEIVELRVEIQDRTHTPVNCPDTDLTCSVISDPSCLQRLTWRVEVR
ncbi:MAG: hypothetical protein ABI591_24300 [Kofleriaceae bacterium]